MDKKQILYKDVPTYYEMHKKQLLEAGYVITEDDETKTVLVKYANSEVIK